VGFVGTVDSPQIRHPQIEEVLEVAGFAATDALPALHAVLIKDKCSKRVVCRDPEDVRFQDRQCTWENFPAEWFRGRTPGLID
jgi:hypothetical protein